jgi:hypothetical protein
MTGSNLLVLAPWIVFGAGLAVVMFRLGRPRYRSSRVSPPSGQPESGAPGEAPPGPPTTAGRGQRGSRTRSAAGCEPGSVMSRAGL